MFIISILKYFIVTIAFIIILKITGYIFQLIYFFIFKKHRNNNQDKSNDIVNNDSLQMIQCEKCKTYTSKNEAYVLNGKFFCKKEHSE